MKYQLAFTCKDCKWSAEGRADGLPIKFFISGWHPDHPDHSVWLEITEEEVQHDK